MCRKPQGGEVLLARSWVALVLSGAPFRPCCCDAWLVAAAGVWSGPQDGVVSGEEQMENRERFSVATHRLG